MTHRKKKQQISQAWLIICICVCIFFLVDYLLAPRHAYRFLQLIFFTSASYNHQSEMSTHPSRQPATEFRVDSRRLIRMLYKRCVAPSLGILCLNSV